MNVHSVDMTSDPDGGQQHWQLPASDEPRNDMPEQAMKHTSHSTQALHPHMIPLPFTGAALRHLCMSLPAVQCYRGISVAAN